MHYYKMNIAGCERKLPLCPINDSLSIGAFVIFGDPELTTAASKALLITLAVVWVCLAAWFIAGKLKARSTR